MSSPSETDASPDDRKAARPCDALRRTVDRLPGRLPNANYVELSDEDEPAAGHETKPFTEPKTLSWQNLTVTATMKRGRSKWLPFCGASTEDVTKRILTNVSGVAKAHSFLAIIGSSGCGKTTLLNCLTKRNLNSLKVEGRILMNGVDIGDDMPRISGYVQQDDVFFGTLTVREHLWFNAVLRLDKTLSNSAREERLEEIMQEMTLKQCEHTTIGLPGALKGLSGGEKKRLAFAAELLTRPSVMFCDEPTSGLDSFTARSVIQTLKVMARKGHTVLATIHQPSSDIFAMFDDLLILGGGRTVFLGSKNDAIEFFSSLGYQCPQNYNICDFFINAVAVIPGQEAESQERILKICKCFEESRFSEAIKTHLVEKQATGGTSSETEMEKSDKEASRRNKYQANWYTQCKMCCWRHQTENIRNKRIYPVKFLQFLVIGLFVGAIFWQQPNNETGVANINAAMFMMMIQVMFNTSSALVMRNFKTFPALVKEHYDRLYSISAFYVGGFLIEIPFAALVCWTYSTCAYWMIGLYPDAGTYFIITSLFVFIGCTGCSTGSFCGSLVHDPQLGLLLQSVLIGVQLLFSGFLLKEGYTPAVFKLLKSLSTFYYGYEVLIISQWRNVDSIECDAFKPGDVDLQQVINVTVPTASHESMFCLSSGMDIIYSFGYDPDDIGYCFGMLMVLFIILEVLAYVALLIKVRSAK